MSAEIQFTLNGRSQRVSTDPQRPLLDILREDLGLTGTKFGCGEGSCRACTVLVDGEAMKTCRLQVSSVAGKKIETIESLSPPDATADQLHPVQKAFIEHEAMQCGYCVPGMIMATVGLLREKKKPSRDEIVEALNGNICRCCNYNNILKAVELAATNAA
jgi:aerobic-type carbon monoxide dehydrogenase small subunit (CoxS/CutS family)